MQRLSMFLAVLISSLSLTALAACGPAPSTVPDGNWASVRDDVFIPSCSCHTGAEPAAGLALDGDSVSSVLDVDAGSNFDGFKYIVAGEPEQSLIYLRLSGGADGVAAMPPSSSGLEDAEVVAAIAAWIESGAGD